MDKKKIAIIFGGSSSEYGVSLKSAFSVVSNMDVSKYEPVLVGISKSGEWYLYTGTPDGIIDDTWNDSTLCTPAAFSPNKNQQGLMVFRDDGIEIIRLDGAFPVLHGKNGEDGTVQGVIQLSGVPLIGCDTLSSAVGMNKDKSHQLAKLAGIDVPNSFVFEKNVSQILLYDSALMLGYPLYVKPLNEGSSFGITKVKNKEQLLDAVNFAFEYDNQIIMEENIEGFEVGCAIIGNDELFVGEVDEIEVEGGFFDNIEKYTQENSTIHVPARISQKKAEEIKDKAKIIYEALGCKCFVRVDMFLTPDGRIVFNEVNTIPGMTTCSRFPNMLKAGGMSFPELIDEVITLGVNA